MRLAVDLCFTVRFSSWLRSRPYFNGDHSANVDSAIEAVEASSGQQVTLHCGNIELSYPVIG
jgi:hypothetical protein